MKTTFKEFLEEKCFDENPQVLDDNMPDHFDNWLGDLSTEDWMDLGQECANLAFLLGQKECLEKMNSRGLCAQCGTYAKLVAGGTACEECHDAIVKQNGGEDRTLDSDGLPV